MKVEQITSLPVNTRYQHPGGQTMKKEDMKTIIEKYLDAYNTFDIKTMMSFIHPDIEFTNVSGGEVNAAASGVDSFRKLAEDAGELFAERRQTSTNYKYNKNIVFVKIDYEGVLAVDLPNGMKEGETLRFEGLSEFEFSDGKIVRITDRS